MDENRQQEEKSTEDKLQECEKLRDEYLAGWQRCKADFLNYKKEELERAASLMDFAKAQLILGILPIIDSWERALLHAPEDCENSEWFKGVKQIESQLKDFLRSEVIEEIKAAGERFNPELHEAIEEIEDGGVESGTIIEVLEKGYTINGRLLRPARVKVAK